MGDNNLTKKEILTMLQKGVLTVEEAIQMINNLELRSTDSIQTPVKVKEETFDEVVDKIVDEAVSDMKVDEIYDIMTDLHWEYASHDNAGKLEPVTTQSIVEVMKYVTRHAILCMVKNKEENNEPFGMCSTGGFDCSAWVDDGDTEIQVELKFVPHTGYAGYEMEKLMKLKSKNE